MASKKLRNVQSGTDEEMRVDMSPMIDMVFLLLIFFLVNATLIIVEMDKTVKVPIAKHSVPQESGHGRIVINVYGDEHVEKGRFRTADGTTAFPETDDLVEYIKEQMDIWKQKGYDPMLHLRAHDKVHFTYVRQAIRAAAAAGVNEVIFITLQSHLE